MKCCRKNVFMCILVLCNVYLIGVQLTYIHPDLTTGELTKDELTKDESKNTIPIAETARPSVNGTEQRADRLNTEQLTDRLNTRVMMGTLLTQRNQLSRQLNSLRRDLGQLECRKGRTSLTGGWCLNISRPSSKQHKLDQSLAKAMSTFLSGKTVASFGEGPGLYQSIIQQEGRIELYDAFDGAPFTETVSHGAVAFLDLTVPQYGLRLYDWVISLEVAEHIPERYENVYLDNLFRHARSGIILSWATPEQKGMSHVNGRPLEYVKKTMKANGFDVATDLTAKLQKAADTPWLKTNVFVYKRVGYLQYINVKQLRDWHT